MFDQSVLTAIQAHAMEVFPHESCGVVTADGYVRFANLSANPEHEFECDDQLQPMLAAGTVLALVHSHPNGPYAPSAYDIAQQVAMDVPWGIAVCRATASLPVFFWGDALTPPKLLERPFRYGPSGTDGRGDCAALIRDYYLLERQVRLKEFPRQNGWWLRDDVSYRDNLLATGFVPIDGEPEVGDVFLAAIRSRRPNHAGIYVGNGIILHHLENRLSRTEPSVIWRRFYSGWFRHAD